MSLQSFETLRKVNDLGAGIAAGALLLGQGLSGLLTTRPSRLALQPMDGTKGSIVEVSVAGAQEIALLSKDTAVVLAEGGVLWALLDLQGSPKLRQIANDVRALCPRSHGESAFAIGEDGKGIALTLGRNDVGVRTFAMRGALHACDVGEQVTYALVDGDGGRQLRVHPGATPELGTSARVTLPEGASSLDRVRGGPTLSAVYKRGDERVCLVHGTTKLEAKLLRLDAKPADVAVLDGALWVAFVDGRISFYDRDAIESAGEAPLVATATVALGAQGRPRVLLAGTSKTLSALWIGTTAGEIYRAGGAAQGEVASQRPGVQTQAKSNATELAAQLAARESELEGLRAEIEGLKAAHADELAAREADRARALEAQSDAHRTALEERITAHREASEEREAAHRKVVQEEGATYREALEESQAAQRKALEEREASHQKVLAEHEAAQQKALEEREASHQKVLAEHEAAQQKALEEATAKLAEVTATLNETTAKLAEATAKLAAAEAQLVTRTAELEAHSQEREAHLQGELAAARGTLAAAEAQLSSRAADLDARNKAYEDVRAEVSRLMTDLTAERDRIEKVFPFGSDGLRSAERARGRLDGVVAQIQGILFKRPHD